MSIRDWPTTSVPEKLLQRGLRPFGCRTAGDFLRSGYRAAARWISPATCSSSMAACAACWNSTEGILRDAGLGLAKYAQLQAVLELAGATWRIPCSAATPSRAWPTPAAISWPECAITTQVFACLFLDNKHE